MRINDLSARIATHGAKLTAAIDRVVSRGWFILGSEVEQFEKSFASYLGAGHCVGVANGTDAIELALRALGIGRGDRVATVANAGMYTTTALLALGAEPSFMDVDLETRGATLEGVTRAIEAGVKAVVVTHLYGLAIPEIAAIAEHCSRRGVRLLEDCAQAHGALVGLRRAGTFGDAASFSFYPTKNLGALGDAGAVVTNNEPIAERVRLLRNHGWASRNVVTVEGARNSRLDEVQAAILSVFLPELDAGNARRREITARYSAQLRHPEVLAPQTGGADYVAHLYVVRSSRREALRDHLSSAGIGSAVHFPIPDYRQPVFGDRFAATHLENTERLTKEILTLPCYPEMSDAQVDRVISAVNRWSS